MVILGIESSCDETAAAVVENGDTLLSNVVATQIDIHKEYGGVVPEIAARSHIEAILPVIHQALQVAYPTLRIASAWDRIDGIAVTYGAGLLGSLLIGSLTARTIALLKDKPLYAVNHVEGHVYANFLTKTTLKGYSLPKTQPTFPLLALIVSGKHVDLVYFRNHFDYDRLGHTRDDAIGEAFDKVAKILGLEYPGGPSIAKAAQHGMPNAYYLPKAKLAEPYNFSFSGLKTAVLRAAQTEIGEDHHFPSHLLAERLSVAQKANLAASFQHTAIETVVDKTVAAYEHYKPKSVVIAGGVAASQELRRQLQARLPIDIAYTDPKLCTDNGAMIATLGCFVAALQPKLGVAQSKAKSRPVDPLTLQTMPSLTL